MIEPTVGTEGVVQREGVHLVRAVNQSFGKMGANEAVGSGDQYFHCGKRTYRPKRKGSMLSSDLVSGMEALSFMTTRRDL